MKKFLVLIVLVCLTLGAFKATNVQAGKKSPAAYPESETQSQPYSAYPESAASASMESSSNPEPQTVMMGTVASAWIEGSDMWFIWHQGVTEPNPQSFSGMGGVSYYDPYYGWRSLLVNLWYYGRSTSGQPIYRGYLDEHFCKMQYLILNHAYVQRAYPWLSISADNTPIQYPTWRFSCLFAPLQIKQ